MLDCFHETNADYAILTETWLNEGAVKELTEELSLGSGIGMITKNRPRCENGVTYGTFLDEGSQSTSDMVLKQMIWSMHAPGQSWT